MHGGAQPDCWAGLQKQANFTRLSGSRSGETDPFEFRAEAFNIFNHRIFGIPNNDVFSTNFGSVSGTANNPRQLQLNDKSYSSGAAVHEVYAPQPQPCY